MVHNIKQGHYVQLNLFVTFAWKICEQCNTTKILKRKDIQEYKLGAFNQSDINKRIFKPAHVVTNMADENLVKLLDPILACAKSAPSTIKTSWICDITLQDLKTKTRLSFVYIVIYGPIQHNNKHAMQAVATDFCI